MSAAASRHDNRANTATFPPPRLRALRHARSTAALGGECWCAAEPYRLPLTAAGANEDCLCPQCLRKAAAQSER